ncbi:GNAT superfamily N-acetyltransferase [Actinoplanes octamycinicus]|uniref:GNAT superfamily N-acetyltransferase n=1 Tax=Actinoplanes octamycinicus TaxID=135948 RepID=A0A7W7M4Q9_9ACTN|nr:GNAT family N-acetyltransferase [Actinoplanes octamycinicus]MBB4736920.1 GNAT superfamily N-acetyltransferase [Actinoplanes octamycinicus]GIE63357.1 N-acetyltransferase [Actinoplanes octamycinicus]
MGTVIRALTPDDVDEVAAVHVRSTRASQAGILPAEHLAALDPAVFAARRRSVRAEPGRQTLVAEREGRIAGFASFGPDREEPALGELYAIYVDPAHWGGDAGWLLFAAVRDALRDRGFPEMRLWVLAGNERARHFYERAGMTTDGMPVTHRAGAGIDVPKLRYRRPL